MQFGELDPVSSPFQREGVLLEPRLSGFSETN